MDFENFDEEDNESFPRKRPRSVYENQRNSTPVREAPPSPAAPLRMEERDEKGEGVIKGDEEDSVPDAKRKSVSTDIADDAKKEERPDYFGLSQREDMESFIEEVEHEDGEGPQARWEELSVEVWQLIFQRVPLLDLVTSGRRVCQRWNQIITDDSFLHWKKLYFHLKYTDQHAVSRVTTMLHPLNAHVPRSRVLTAYSECVCLARIFSKQFNHLGINWDTVLSVISKHPQYDCVVEIEKQMYSSQAVLSVPERLLLLVACCTSVHQVLLLIDLLCGPVSGGFSPPALGYREMSEMFYAMATFFLFLRNSDSHRHTVAKFHYNVLYSLDAIERSEFVPPLCQLSLPPSPIHSTSLANDPQSFPPPPPFVDSSHGNQSVDAVYVDTNDVALSLEQARVVRYPVKEAGKIIKVIGFAGTGKTTTLVQFALRNAHLRIGYCAYNKLVVDNAEKFTFKNCQNVECCTFHSIALQFVGHDCQSAKADSFEKLTTYQIAEYVSDQPPVDNLSAKESLYCFAKYVKGTLDNYWASMDSRITKDHVPQFRHSDSDRAVAARVVFRLGYRVQLQKDECTSNDHYISRILEETRRVWNKMKSLSIPMAYDGHLKLFQLNVREKNWDVLLVDDAQDLSPAIIDVVLKTSCFKILAEDPHQRVHSTEDAMSLVRADHTYYLTKSFRFGPEISYISDLILRLVKEQETLVGTVNKGCVFGTRKFRQVAIIARTNLGLFEEMAKVLRAPEGKRKKLGFVGGIDSYEFYSLKALHTLFTSGSRAKQYSNYAKMFDSFTELEKYVEHGCDVELQLKRQIYINHRQDILSIIGRLKRQSVDDLSLADVIFMTAHKSKGLQFDNVMIADDFLPVSGIHLPISGLLHNTSVLRMDHQPDVEYNLLYLATTRAKCQLTLSPTCHSALLSLMYPVAARNAHSEVADGCALCDKNWFDCRQSVPKLFLPAIKKTTCTPWNHTYNIRESLTTSHREGIVCHSCGNAWI